MKISASTVLSVVVLFCFAVYSLSFASWTDPTDTAPAGNAEVPINVGASTQIKAGNLAANIFAALSQVWSDEYCDSLGQNCFNPADISIVPFTLQNVGNITNGQTVNVTCDGTNEVLTGGGCRVTGSYDELATDEGDILSYPSPNVPQTWTCENKNLAVTNVTVYAICLSVPLGSFGGA